jgi:hypothetical protein
VDREEIIDRAARSFYEASCRVDHIAPNDWADVRVEIKDNCSKIAARVLKDLGFFELLGEAASACDWIDSDDARMDLQAAVKRAEGSK